MEECQFLEHRKVLGETITSSDETILPKIPESMIYVTSTMKTSLAFLTRLCYQKNYTLPENTGQEASTPKEVSQLWLYLTLLVT